MRKILLLLFSLTLPALFIYHASASSIVIPTTIDSSERALVRASYEAFRSLPGKERRQKLLEARREIKKFKAARKAGKEADTNLLVLVVLAILLPPLAVYLHEHDTNTKFWITLLLFLLGIAGAVFISNWLIFAAIVYALIIVLGGA